MTLRRVSVSDKCHIKWIIAVIWSSPLIASSGPAAALEILSAKAASCKY